VQTGVGLIGSSGDIWNDYTSNSALEAGVGLNFVTGASSGATLTVSGSNGIYQYAYGPSLSGSTVDKLGSGELGGFPTTDNPLSQLTLNLTHLTANTTYNIYLLSSPDKWERASSWSVNGGTAQTVGPLNSYTGPNRPPYAYGGTAPYGTVLGINELQLSGTTDALGQLTISGTGLLQSDGTTISEVDINGFQLQAVAAPEPSTWALLVCGFIGLLVIRRKCSSTV
jgi:hypothetical protein